MCVLLPTDNTWTAPPCSYPNNTGSQPSFLPLGWEHDCGTGCLFDIIADPTEHNDLAGQQPALLGSMAARLAVLNKGNFNPDRGLPDRHACVVAAQRGGYYGPFIDIS